MKSATRSRAFPATSTMRPSTLAALLLFAMSQSAMAQGSDGAQAADQPHEASLPAVSVTASQDTLQHLRDDVSSGALGSRTQLETPFSTTIVTGEELADRQANKLGDVFAQDASVSDNSNPYNAWASYITVRGMQLDWQNGFKLDGQPYNGYGITMPYEQLESVELLKGLSGFMYGFGAPGGVVNYVTKKPPATEKQIASVDVGYRSTSVWTEHLDLGGRVGPDSVVGYRFNATHEEGKTYNDGNVRRDSFSLAADARLTRDLTATFGALYQERHASGITTAISTARYTGTSLPATLSGGSSTLQTPDQHLNTNLQIYTAGLHYNLSPDWTLSATYSFSKSTRYRNEGTWYLLDQAGDYDDYRFEGKEGHQLNTFRVMAEGLVKTGPLRHQLVFGADYQKQTTDYGANSFYAQLGTGNLYQPNVNRYDSSGFYTYRAADVTQKALFASDTIALTERWSVLGGLRYTNYEQHGYGLDGSTSSTYTQNGVLTPTVALMYKLTPGTTLYASYVESLEAGNVVGDTYANAGQLLAAAQQAIRSRREEPERTLERDGRAVPHRARRAVCQQRQRLRRGRRVDLSGCRSGRGRASRPGLDRRRRSDVDRDALRERLDQQRQSRRGRAGIRRGGARELRGARRSGPDARRRCEIHRQHEPQSVRRHQGAGLSGDEPRRHLHDAHRRT